MRKILTTFLIILTLNSYSQKLKLSGQIFSFALEETGNIYYTKEGEKFDKNRFIKYDKEKRFLFEMNISKIKKDSLFVLVFSLDTNQLSNDLNACVQRINIGKIVNSTKFNKLKTIDLKTDLLLNINCESSEYYDSRMDNKNRFVGTYRFIINDTTFRQIKLENEFFNYKSVFSEITEEYMTEEFGRWSFNEENKELVFKIRRQSNQEYGLIISKSYQFEFKVEESEKGIKLIPKNGIGTITKL